MITINSTDKNIITFSENEAVIKEIKRASRNAQMCFVKKMGVENFQWVTDWDLKLKAASEKFILANPSKPRASKFDKIADEKLQTGLGSDIASEESEEYEVKVTSNGDKCEKVIGYINGHSVTASDVKETERVYVCDDGTSVTVVSSSEV